MKRIYWRPPGVSRRAMLLITTLSVLVLLAVELLPVKTKQEWYDEKLQAAHLTRQAMGIIKAEKARLGIAVDPEADPQATGMYGVALSPVTSNTGYLNAKRTSVNPNWAAVLVHLLKRCGVQPGDVVALGLSGSFPSLNIASFAAVQTLKLEPISIVSASASQWGANNPELLWIDMERVLFEKNVLRHRSVAASPGGIDDLAYGMSKEGRAIIDQAISRNNLHPIIPKDLQDSIEQRMDVYQQHAQGRPIRAYINIGGGAASVGTHVGKKLFRIGLNRNPPRDKDHVDSVMLRFAERDVPVVHITSIARLAARYGLAVEPEEMPRPGEGNVFYRLEYNRWLAAGGIVLIFAVMLAFIRMDVGMRILKGVKRKTGSERQPEPMV
jgi:poly-gamma-glutamate system protein